MLSQRRTPFRAGNFLSLIKRYIFCIFRHCLIGRADDLAAVGELLHAVGAPAHGSGDGEDRRIELGRKSQHLINKTGEEVDVGADALVHPGPLRDHPGREPFYRTVEFVLLLEMLFRAQISGEYLLKTIDSISQVMNRIQGEDGSTSFEHLGKLEKHLQEMKKQESNYSLCELEHRSVFDLRLAQIQMHG